MYACMRTRTSMRAFTCDEMCAFFGVVLLSEMQDTHETSAALAKLMGPERLARVVLVHQPHCWHILLLQGALGDLVNISLANFLLHVMDDLNFGVVTEEVLLIGFGPDDVDDIHGMQSYIWIMEYLHHRVAIHRLSDLNLNRVIFLVMPHLDVVQLRRRVCTSDNGVHCWVAWQEHHPMVLGARHFVSIVQDILEVHGSTHRNVKWCTEQLVRLMLTIGRMHRELV